jgi:hypothetical protein
MTRFASILMIFLFFIIAPSEVSAQQTETLFSGDVEHGGFGSLLYGVTSVNGEASYLRGTRGAWMLKFRDGHALNIGLGSYRTHSGFDARGMAPVNGEVPELRTNYGGFEVEYLNRSHRLIHYGLQATIGGGTVRYRDRNIDLPKTSDSYFAFQPGANVHLNITNWFRISGGVFYRYAGGVNLEGTSDSDLSGVSAVFGLRFGKF